MHLIFINLRCHHQTFCLQSSLLASMSSIYHHLVGYSYSTSLKAKPLISHVAASRRVLVNTAGWGWSEQGIQKTSIALIENRTTPLVLVRRESEEINTDSDAAMVFVIPAKPDHGMPLLTVHLSYGQSSTYMRHFSADEHATHFVERAACSNQLPGPPHKQDCDKA